MKSIDTESRLYLIVHGRVLISFRLRAGYSSANNFAEANYVHSGQYGRYEKGGNVSVKTLKHLLSKMNRTPAEFYIEVEKQFNEELKRNQTLDTRDGLKMKKQMA